MSLYTMEANPVPRDRGALAFVPTGPVDEFEVGQCNHMGGSSAGQGFASWCRDS